ncbi:pilus assembly protein [Marinomonas sp. C1424]|uniref:Pilus assembly protein n=1 Tax=Marinomonas transparens TaxID=2795388 RepID=A0A934N4M4_9GAMM|nr:pilus assembly protein [Marinomonas transparens]
MLSACKRALARLCKTQANATHPSFLKDQSGAVAPFAVLALVGALIAISFAVDTSRMINSSAQVKRATDAAAMAIGNIELRSGNEGKLSDLQTVAYGYVKNNLGMDAELLGQIAQSQIRVSRGKSDNGVTYSVSVTLNAQSALLGAEEVGQVISSTTEVVTQDTEVALVIPNSAGSASSANLSALHELSKDFMGELDVEGGNVWFSLIPFMSSVNVFDPDDPDRIHRWSKEGALNPPALRSLFRTGKLRSLADPRAPDVITHRLCMFRGLGVGENAFWDEPPTSQFGVYYSAGSAGNQPFVRPVISWDGPNPVVWPDPAVGAREIWPQKACPIAPLLPLTSDVDKLDARFAQMQPVDATYNNLAIAMGWAGSSLAPNMRGAAGWGDSKLPLDFNESVKAIVVLFDADDYSGDTNGYNRGSLGSNGSGAIGLYGVAQRRFRDLCRDFRSKDIKFFMLIAFPSGEVEGPVGNEISDLLDGRFGTEAVPSLQTCTGNGGALYAISSPSFSEGRSQFKKYLKTVAGKIRSNYYVRLIN